MAFSPDQGKRKFSRNAFYGILDNLEKAVLRLEWEPTGTEWHDYYDSNNNYDAVGFSHKLDVVKEFLETLSFRTIWDLGANTGIFSKLAAGYGEYVCAWDMDPACVELNYREIKKSGTKNIYPLKLDLTNPSPGIGWNNSERISFKDRGPVDLVLALGLIHHLAITHNIPLDRIASFLSGLSHYLVMEFVPKSDSQVTKLLRNREDIFHSYDINHFEDTFSRYFNILEKRPIENSHRILYLMNHRDNDPGQAAVLQF